MNNTPQQPAPTAAARALALLLTPLFIRMENEGREGFSSVGTAQEIQYCIDAAFATAVSEATRAVTEALDTAGCAIADSTKRPYSLTERVADLVTSRDYFLRTTDGARAACSTLRADLTTAQRQKQEIAVDAASTLMELKEAQRQLAEAQAKAFPHSCCDGHERIGFSNGPAEAQESCPVCVAKDALEDSEAHNKYTVEESLRASAALANLRGEDPKMVFASGRDRIWWLEVQRQLAVSQAAEKRLRDLLQGASTCIAAEHVECRKEIAAALAPSAVPPFTADLSAFWHAQGVWSQETFGPDSERGPIGPLKHLAKEAVEAQANPGDLMEFVDCLFLTFDATRRAGFTFDQLCTAAWWKLAANTARTWPKPTKGDEAVEHDRSNDATAPRAAAGETPRTNATIDANPQGPYGLELAKRLAGLSATLERELAQMTADRDALAKERDALIRQNADLRDELREAQRELEIAHRDAARQTKETT